MSRALRFVPLLLLALVIAGLVWRLGRPDDTTVASKLVGKPLPDVALSPLEPGVPPLRLRSLVGEPMIVNFFASWCVPCIAEAPVLGGMKRRGARIVGIAVRDRPDDVRTFLAEHGNPYRTIAGDPESRAQIALGSSGVPESFVVDGHGVVRYQHIGPIEPDDVPLILAKLAAAR